MQKNSKGKLRIA